MITSSFDNQRVQATIVLQPNRSWTWRANLYLIASLLLISLSVGIVLSLMGYWVVLVFTAVEISLLAACLHYCVSRTHQQEVLRFSQERLVMESGTRRPQERINVQRLFARFLFHAPTRNHRTRQLALRVGKQEIEVGSFLSEAEKEALVRILSRTIARLDASPLA